MSFSIVLGQMLMIFVLMMLGFVCGKKNMISEKSAKDISALVVNLCNPAILISSVMGGSSISRKHVLFFVAITVIAYICLVILGYFLANVLRVSKKRKSDYILMTIFSNVGFIGIPVVTGLLGKEALIYVAIYNLGFIILMYTYGIYLIGKDGDGTAGKFNIKECVNPGTIASVFTIIIFWFQIPIPGVVNQLLDYVGQPATLLSMVVIGASLARMNLKEMVQDVRLLVFTVIRFLIFPIVAVGLSKWLVPDATMRGVLAILLAVPVGNLSAMLAKQYGRDDSLLAKGIVYTTVLSVITITVTCMFL